MRALPFLVLLGLALTSNVVSAGDPLPSWNDNESKRAIIAFVDRVTTAGQMGFLPEEERIAVFDNDGTLWAERPVYFQLLFAIDRVKALAPEHPEWNREQPFQAVLDDDHRALAKAGKKGLLKLIAATHAGMTSDEFSVVVAQWLSAARHPELNRPYTDLVYQPMLEVLEYLREKGFTTYIVSGGGIEFLRVFSESVYGIPREQVVGSSIRTEFQLQDGVPVLMRLPQVNFINDKSGKPVGINAHIGRRPIAAFGNSDGDYEMLQWTQAGSGPRLMVLVHHTDNDREWAYDRDSHVGRLDRGLQGAKDRSWTIVDMKKDWKAVYPPQQ